MLIEREDSIAPNWNKIMQTLNLSNNELVDFDTFLKIYKLFRLEID